jgi:hypothetical protein
MYTIVRMITWIPVTWRWGDWPHWKKYQSTILYVIMLDLLYNFLTYNYPMWRYEPTIIPNHTMTNLIVMFIGYPCTLLIYLGRYPINWIKQIGWVIFWVTIWSFIELVNSMLGGLTYHNSWDFKSSVIFNLVAFPMVRLHYKKPLLAYGLSALITVGLSLLFKVPVGKMK